MKGAIKTGGVVVFILLLFSCSHLSLQVSKAGNRPAGLLKSYFNSSQDFPTDTFITNLLAGYPRYFDSILKNRDALGIQIIYTRIDGGKKGKIKFTDHSFNLDPGRYFYPASTVKLPVAILALQKLNELKIAGLDKNTMMITGTDGDDQTGVNNDPSTSNGPPSIAHYIKKILLVSNNDAFNRLYEFLGQEYINNSLHKLGYADAQIIHRLSISLSEEQNRHTNPVEFYDSTGRLVYKKEAERCKMVYAERNTKSDSYRMGTGYYSGQTLIHEPFDFSKKNRMPLQYLHNIVRSIMFPDEVPELQRFNLTAEDYDFLRKYMSMLPQESKFPFYSSTEYWDSYVKFLLYGSEKGTTEPAIRIFNKVGDAYGFMIDAAYVADFKNKIEFQLSAVIYCNSDGIFNDDKYEYDGLGLPFMKHLGQIFYDYELKRQRKKTNLSRFIFQYSD
jgi:hypothetical protein